MTDYLARALEQGKENEEEKDGGVAEELAWGGWEAVPGRRKADPAEKSAGKSRNKETPWAETYAGVREPEAPLPRRRAGGLGSEHRETGDREAEGQETEDRTAEDREEEEEEGPGVVWAASVLERALGGRPRGLALPEAAGAGQRSPEAGSWSIQGGTWGAAPLLEAVRKAQTGSEFVRGQRRALTVTLPEAAGTAGEWSLDRLDRAVERDARRYDGGFSLY